MLLAINFLLGFVLTFAGLFIIDAGLVLIGIIAFIIGLVNMCYFWVEVLF